MNYVSPSPPRTLYLLPLRRASYCPKISTSSRECPHFIAPVPAADSFTPGLVSSLSSITHPQKNSLQPLSGLLVSHSNPHLGFPVTQQRPLSGSHLCTENRFSSWRQKNPESNGMKGGHFFLVLFLTDIIFSYILNRYSNSNIFDGDGHRTRSDFLPKLKYKRFKHYFPTLIMVANSKLPSYHDSSTHTSLEP